MPDPFRAPDDEARALALRLMSRARHTALAYAEAGDGLPGISRIAVALDPEGRPLTLVSDLAPHSAALRAHPDCALLFGEPGAKGDPLTHPRLMLRACAEELPRGTPAAAAVRALWLARHPRAKLYVDFGDFRFFRLAPVSALLNAGFGQAFRLAPEDLAP